jgi:hypothetical protein
VLLKKNWIFPYFQSTILENEAFKNNIKALFDRGQNELMVVRYDQQEKVLDRGFIVRRDWPN